MKLGYIILAHEKPEQLGSLLSCLLEFGDTVVLHFDKSSPHYSSFPDLKERFPSLILCESIEVEWGESSIVRATLEGMKAIAECGAKVDYVTLLSGSCMPVKSRKALVAYLKQHKGREFIECHDIRQSKWVVDGLEWDRWEIFHFINWRKHPRLFTYIHKFQLLLGIKRNFPFGKKMFMGSQWWTLSLDMVRQILEIANGKLLSYIDKTWVPDEFFFQTIVGNLIAPDQIECPLTHYRFNELGIPKIFAKDDQEELKNTDKFFARKFRGDDYVWKDEISKRYRNESELFDVEPTVEYFLDCFPGMARNRLGFRFDFRDYLLPLVVMIDCDYDGARLRELGNSLRRAYSGFNLFGRLFDSDCIDYAGAEAHILYSPDNTELRDYNIQEFLVALGVSSPKGFGFVLNSYIFPHMLDFLLEMPNVTIVDFTAEIHPKVKTIKDSYKLENYLAGKGCKYVRMGKNREEEFIGLIETIQENNMYLNAHGYTTG